ncbi:flap structure-specific endonuclease [Ephemerocybe angulata]|uniref:Flap structure-specific endonuclease n=1 Tax=Ephemerocybe angulata TaxID=980116 RepID=A0A8H6M4I7_9AGAR|nr:flap structure-specific endonuclease [Tulosesus angulatus]
MGVKSLWSLLTPVGRPVMLETMEGKVMAIDSSIWIYQFQATMRDKEGRALTNAHVLGFLRRITKLLFYGIKPVFVFDGGAPALKRSTLNERRKKKSGAAVSHAKLAERLLAAQLRREAVKQASKGKEKEVDLTPLDNPNTVYLEDIDGSAPKTPVKRKAPTPSSSTKKKGKFHDHDPYKLPEVDMGSVVGKLTQASAPDPRLATEEELREFIEDMRPEDFDVNSPAFRELPTEVQYEIIGDLRLKSRQTSFARLQKMLKHSRTPLDFSKQQILNLKQRNTLTQQLLVTTDTIGSAHISIPVRIASERNKEYVLVKNDDGSGGWILGVKDTTGTSREKPIEIDQDPKEEESEEDEDADMEEVEVPPADIMDPDLQEYQRGNARSAISNRNTDKGLEPISRRPIIRKRRANPLFEMNDSDLSDDELLQMTVDQDEEDDESLAFAIQASLDQTKQSSSRGPLASSSAVTLDSHPRTPDRRMSTAARAASPTPSNEWEDMYETPNRLSTALTFAHSHHTPQSRRKATDSGSTPKSMFGRPSLLMNKSQPAAVQVESESDEDMEPVDIKMDSAVGTPTTASRERSVVIEMGNDEISTETLEHPLPTGERSPMGGSFTTDSVFEPTRVVTPTLPPAAASATAILALIECSCTGGGTQPSSRAVTHGRKCHNVKQVRTVRLADTRHGGGSSSATRSSIGVFADGPSCIRASFAESNHKAPSPDLDMEQEQQQQDAEHQDFDAAAEMDPHAEEGEFANFLSQVKGRDLHQQKKAAMRDAEDVNQQMISQIMTMLRLFGIPYITAPMEAEAQCAELVTLGLVDGVITDDSDVFLFGAARVFKNMFNQSKTVECFLSADLERELGLDRDTLGLPGVGPVVAMELLKDFPGKDGLWRFREWWAKVQSGKDKDESGQPSKFKKMFKKKFVKDLYLASDWPNTVVRDAYYHPAVDSSEEPFKWGLPDLDGLRGKQANAVNQQSNLNDFLGVGGGSGTMAPRQRQAYASKRLQEVVKDFRKRRAGASREQSAAVEAKEDDDAAGTKRKGKAKAKPVAAEGDEAGEAGIETSSTTKRKTAPRKKAGAAKGRGKKKASTPNESDDDSGSEFDETGDGTVDVEVPLKVELRPRPKPRPLKRPLEKSPEGDAEIEPE